MNKRAIIIITIFIMSLFSISALATSSLEENASNLSYQHTGDKYPSVFFYTNIEGDGFKEKLESFNAFTKLDKKSIGLPIAIRVVNGITTKRDATNTTSLLASISTLGIVPIVSNQSYIVRYDVLVQGRYFAEFEYEIASTDVSSFWSKAAMEGKERSELKPEEEQFLELSMIKFLRDLKENQDVQSIFNEYNQYFGSDLALVN